MPKTCSNPLKSAQLLFWQLFHWLGREELRLNTFKLTSKLVRWLRDWNSMKERRSITKFWTTNITFRTTKDVTQAYYQSTITFLSVWLNFIWGKGFKNGPNKTFKGCLSQILLGPFVNTLSHICKQVVSNIITDKFYHKSIKQNESKRIL